MKGLVLTLLLLMNTTAVEAQTMDDAHHDKTVVDFSKTEAWSSIDDVVMGGVSRSEMVVEDGIAIFRGELSLENNGGFASVRSRAADYDLSGFDGVALRVRGDGKQYKFRLRTTTSFDGVSYEATFDTPSGEWEDVVIPFSSFRPVFRGRTVRDYPPLDPSIIKTLGLMIAEKQEGRFRLEVESIAGVASDD